MESDCFPLGCPHSAPTPTPVCTRHETLFLQSWLKVMDASYEETFAVQEQDTG